MKKIIGEYTTQYAFEQGEEKEMNIIYDDIVKTGKSFITKPYEIIVDNKEE